jgi:hypothetical protein
VNDSIIVGCIVMVDGRCKCGMRVYREPQLRRYGVATRGQRAGSARRARRRRRARACAHAPRGLSALPDQVSSFHVFQSSINNGKMFLNYIIAIIIIDTSAGLVVGTITLPVVF